jgi:hypothetical protein
MGPVPREKVAAHRFAFGYIEGMAAQSSMGMREGKHMHGF